jgi:hypothetical protein
MKRTRYTAERIIQKFKPKVSAKNWTAEMLIVKGKTVGDTSAATSG